MVERSIPYEQRREQARQAAFEWLINSGGRNYSSKELAEWSSFFYLLGSKYELLEEFREIGII